MSQFKPAPPNHPWRDYNQSQWFRRKKRSETERKKRIKELKQSRVG